MKTPAPEMIKLQKKKIPPKKKVEAPPTTTPPAIPSKKRKQGNPETGLINKSITKLLPETAKFHGTQWISSKDEWNDMLAKTYKTYESSTDNEICDESNTRSKLNWTILEKVKVRMEKFEAAMEKIYKNYQDGNLATAKKIGAAVLEIQKLLEVENLLKEFQSHYLHFYACHKMIKDRKLPTEIKSRKKQKTIQKESIAPQKEEEEMVPDSCEEEEIDPMASHTEELSETEEHEHMAP
jgi:hypothetical protein